MRKLLVLAALIAGCGEPPSIFTSGSGGTTTTGGTGSSPTTGGSGGAGGCETMADCDDDDPCTYDFCSVDRQCLNPVIPACNPSGGTAGMGGGGSGGVGGSMTSGGGGGSIAQCGDISTDDDGDGFSENDGDCNDCDPMVNPGAIDIPNMDIPVDDDCNGVIDDLPAPCDDGFALDDADPMHGAAVIGLCTIATDKTPGVVSAQYTRGNGIGIPGALQYGLMATFGPNVMPIEGARMLALSTGHARAPNDPDACGSTACTSNFGSVNVPGFPQAVPGCAPPSPAIRDDVALSLTLRVPTNVTGYAFDFRFYTFDYPEWGCTSDMDQFVAIAAPAPMGAANGGIILDAQQRPPCVAFEFIYVCNGCLLGTADLAGTGFDTWGDAAATPWVTTTTPVKAADTISLRFAIWDLNDTSSDSSALVDNFRWITDPAVALTTK